MQVLYSADPSTYDIIVAAIAANRAVVWQIDSTISVVFNPNAAYGITVFIVPTKTASKTASTIGATYFVLGTAGLAAAVNTVPGFGFVWNKQSNQDDAALSALKSI